MEIRKGTSKDIEELSALYDALNDHLEQHINYPGWRKGIYPAREDAVCGIEENNLFVAVEEGKIVGTIILKNQPEKGYELVDWKNCFDYSEIFVMHTFAVHPQFLGKGIGKKIMEFVLSYAEQMHMKAVRLDVYEKNIPAIRLYESFGFQYMDTVDLGYGMYGLEWFRLYQKLV